MKRWQWVLSQTMRKLWLRASIYALLGVFTAIIAIWAQYYLPWRLPELVGADAVDSLLNIIASSMLAVTTFSLSTMTAAYSAATSNVTPRATTLLIEDSVSQRVLSTFIGAFLFSIVGIIVLKTGAYGASGRSILFVATIIVVALIVINLLQWIDHLTRLGRVGETTDRVEAAALVALNERLAQPYLGGVELLPSVKSPPQDALLVHAGVIGYLQHIDMFALSKIADEQNQDVYVLLNPGTLTSDDTILAWVAQNREGVPDQIVADIRGAFTIGGVRSFDQDPRFGLAVMSEIGSRALSAGINDSGTALDVIGRNTRLLATWAKGPDESTVGDPEHPRIHVLGLSDEDLLEDAFMLMGRDGAGMIEIQLRIQKCLAALTKVGSPFFKKAVVKQADMAKKRAYQALSFDEDRDRLSAVIAEANNT